MKNDGILLEGGAEFGGAMSGPDLAAIEHAGGLDIPIAVLPTAAAPDNNHERAGRNAVHWFRSLGASHVDVVPVIDEASANDPGLASRVRLARLIYMLGGFPRHLAESLGGSHVWEAALLAYESGAVLGGSSAGAMVVCSHYYDPQSAEPRPGLGLLSNCCVLPHYNAFGKTWVPQLSASWPDLALIGIDEQTGILGDASGAWTVYGGGQVTVHESGLKRVLTRGETFELATN